jgi:sulfite reductase alpha subunit-like flavoprotein
MNWDVQYRMELMRKRAAGYKSFSSKEEATVKVLFASETGTAEGLAREFADACQLSHDADAMKDIDVDEINGSTTIFFVSTAGQGSMPRNGIEFLKQLSARKESFAEGTSFSIMGLGDSSYYFFLKAAKDLEKAMLNLGAKCIHPLGEGDDSCTEGGLEEGLHQWQQGIFPALGLQKPEEVPHITPVDLLFSKRVVLSELEDKHAVERYYESIGTKEVRISCVERLSEEGHNRDFITFTLQTGSKGLSYELGDSLEIFPKNDEAEVGNFLHEYSDWDERTVLKLSHAFGVHGEISIGAVFTNMLDIFGKPNMSFLQKLATFEEDAEKRKLMLDPANLRQLCVDKCVTYADLLLMYKSARPPLAALLAMIPTIKGRAYSITTTPSASPDSVELCVLINIFWCKEGAMRYGTASKMLRKLKIGNTVFCRVKPGSMEPPRHDQSGK